MKLKYLLIIPLMFLSIITVKANNISSIKMDIYIKENGDAFVTEVWNADLEQGTEGYKPYYNLGNSEISDFSVKFNEKIFRNTGNWNVNDSFEEKMYKNGIHYIDNGLELCWGISKYGNNEYTLSYKISNFVRELSDAQMVYWTLIPYEFDQRIDYVYIKVHSEFQYADNLDVWGYGTYGAPTYVYDGYIEMTAESGLSSSEYMTLLIKFPLGSFKTSNIHSDESFQTYYDMAEEGSINFENGSKFTVFDMIKIIIQVAFWIITLGFIFGKVANAPKRISFNKVSKAFEKDVPNFRDIPCDKNIKKAFFIADAYNLNKKKTDFLGAILLKWLKEDLISIVETESKILHRKETAIDLRNCKDKLEGKELSLFNMMDEASKDGVLEENEFKKWCGNNYSEILKWFDEVLDEERDALVNEQLLEKVVPEKMKWMKSTQYENTVALKEEAIKLKGLKQFLKEFSSIDEKMPIEVKLWDYYLMYAQVFGIADKVAKQFKKLYPEIINDSTYDINNIVFINNICYSGMNSASAAQTRAQSYSSGGGGFSSGGGGGGSFGGGGGGGGFR